MDFSRIRLAANIAVAIAATSLISGLIVYCKGFSLPGLILMIAGIAVGIIAASILRMLSVVDNPWIVSVEKKSRRSLLFVE